MPAGGSSPITYARIGEAWPVGAKSPEVSSIQAIDLAKALTGAYQQDCSGRWYSSTLTILAARYYGSARAAGLIGGLNQQGSVVANYFGNDDSPDPLHPVTWIGLGTGDLENLVDKCSGQIVCPESVDYPNDPYFQQDPNPIPGTDPLISTAFSTTTSNTTCDPTLELQVPLYDTSTTPPTLYDYGTSYDAAALEVDFIPNYAYVKFNYVFGSDEYPEYVNTGYNDVFGFFLNGQNVALLPDRTVVAIDNVNNGNDVLCDPNNSFSQVFCQSHNAQYFLDNRHRTVLPLEMDGMTFMPPDSSGKRSSMIAEGAVTPGVKNTLRFAITDIGDSIADSFVLLKNPSLISTPDLINMNATVDTCSNGSVKFLPCTTPQPLTCSNFQGSGTVSSLTAGGSFNFNIQNANAGSGGLTVSLSYSDAANKITINTNGTVPVAYATDLSGAMGPGAAVYFPCSVVNSCTSGSCPSVSTGSYTCQLSVVDNGDAAADLFSLWVNTGNMTVTYNSGSNRNLASGSIRSCLSASCPADSGLAGGFYSSAAQATHGFTPYTFSLAGGSLPTGLSLDSSSGLVSGIPIEVGTSNFTLLANDGGSPALTTSVQCSISIGEMSCSTPASIDVNFSDTSIAGGEYVWFNSNISTKGIPSGQDTTILFQNSSVLLTDKKGNLVARIPIPNSVITFSPNNTCSGLYSAYGTYFDSSTQTWYVNVPTNGSDEIFLTGVPFLVPTTGLPGGLNATWNGIFRTNTLGIMLQWRWGAAVYKNMGSGYAGDVDVKSMHIGDCLYSDSSPAGTPENYAMSTNVIGGGTGGGSSNYTGSWSSTQSISFCAAYIPFTTYTQEEWGAAPLTTCTQGGWGAAPQGESPGALLQENFFTVFPTGSFSIGGSYKLTFTSSDAVEAFLPQRGTPGILNANAINPKSSSAGVIAGQLLALELNVAFSEDGFGKTGLMDLYLTSGRLAGNTVGDVLNLANQVVGGALSLLPSKMTLSDLNTVLTNINQNFDGGTTNNGYLSSALPPAKPVWPPGKGATQHHWSKPDRGHPKPIIKGCKK